MGKRGIIINVRSVMLVLIIFYGSVGAISPRSFDFYYFVQQWPPTHCHFLDGCKACCSLQTRKPPNFSIHGLWPSYNNGSGPINCSPSEKFNFPKDSDLEKQLSKYWVSLNCNETDPPKCTDRDFWAYEWEKHGTCCNGDLVHERSYFEKNLNLRKKIDLLTALEAKAIRPNGNKYSLISIRNAIKESTGELPGVSCKNRTQLYEVGVCVDKSDASTVIRCPSYPSSCSSKIVFPSFG